MAFTRRGFLIVALEELVLFAFDKAFLTRGGWQEVKCVYWKVSAGLKSVRTSRMDSFFNLLPLYAHVSRKVISFCRFEVRAHVENVFLLKSALIYGCIQESYFCI